MNKTRRTIFIVAITLIFGLSFMLGVYAGERRFKNFIFGDEELNLSLLKEVYVRLEKNFINKDELKNNDLLIYGAIKGMIETLDDPYTVFFTPEETKKFMEDADGKFDGIGIEIGIRDNSFEVISPLKNTPADKAGLLSGDKILKIDGRELGSSNVDEFLEMIRGPRGTDVVLTIAREGWTKEKDITITRDTIELPSIEWKLIDGDIAHLMIHHFFKETGTDLKNVALEIINSPAKGIILDLRNNSGGYLEVAEEVGGLFLPAKQILLTEQGNTKKEHFVKGSSNLLDYPIVVLINKGTASAGEIIAGALRDVRGSAIIGETSYGKGSIQKLELLSDGSSLKVTSAEWLTPAGEVIMDKGISPDFEVIKNNNNQQLKKAIEVLEEII